MSVFQNNFVKKTVRVLVSRNFQQKAPRKQAGLFVWPADARLNPTTCFYETSLNSRGPSRAGHSILLTSCS